MKLLIVANNAKWRSWPKKVKALQEWFAPKLALEVEVVHTTFDAIPFEMYEAPYLGVQNAWYDKNVLPLAWQHNADIVLFVVNRAQWVEPNRARGWRTDADSGVIELQIAADETEKLGSEWGYFKGTSAFHSHATHELCHALYMFTGQQDITHEVRDKGRGLEEARDGLVLDYSKNKLAFISKALSFAAKLLSSFKRGPTIDQWAAAIREFEGWYPGSRSWRTNNPGNLRYSPFESANDGYSIFKTYEDGWKALKYQLSLAVEGKSKVYTPDMTLLQFFKKYAPSTDNNHPEVYAAYVAKKLGVKVDYQIRNFKNNA